MAQEIQSNNAVNSSDGWKEVAAWTGAGMLAVGAAGDVRHQVGIHNRNRTLSKAQGDYDNRVKEKAMAKMHDRMYNQNQDAEYRKAYDDAGNRKLRAQQAQQEVMRNHWDNMTPKGKNAFLPDAKAQVDGEGYHRPTRYGGEKGGKAYYDAHIKAPSKGILKSLF